MNYEILNNLLRQPGVPGYERPILEYIASQYGRSVYQYGVKIGTGVPRVALTAHTDVIGLVVRYIDENGFLFFGTAGGFDPAVLLSQKVWVAGKKAVVPGVISRVATHMMEDEDQEKVPKITEMCIDIGARSKEDALQVVKVGDPAYLENTGAHKLADNLFHAHGIDDRIGCYICLAVLDRCRQQDVSVSVLLTTQEETGYSYGLVRALQAQDHYDTLIGIDVTHATDTPNVEKAEHGDISLEGGPAVARGSILNHQLAEDLGNSANRDDEVQWEATFRWSGTDLDFAPFIRNDMRFGLVSIPIRYMHSTVEVCSEKVVDATVDLLFNYVKSRHHGVLK